MLGDFGSVGKLNRPNNLADFQIYFAPPEESWHNDA